MNNEIRFRINNLEQKHADLIEEKKLIERLEKENIYCSYTERLEDIEDEIYDILDAIEDLETMLEDLEDEE